LQVSNKNGTLENVCLEITVKLPEERAIYTTIQASPLAEVAIISAFMIFIP